MKKFDYIILNEDDEWLATGRSQTQKEFDQELERIKKEQFERWGEKTGIVVFKAPVMEEYTVL